MIFLKSGESAIAVYERKASVFQLPGQTAGGKKLKIEESTHDE